MKRPDWDSYFMEIAKVVSTRATCDRKHVGAVVVSQEHQILSTGYNGPPPGAEHCDDVGHQLVDGHCVRTVHAEANAIAQAAKNGVVLRWATIYTTASPCYDCAKLVANTGMKKVVFDEQYDSRYGMSGSVAAFLVSCGVTVSGFKGTWRRDGGPTDVEKAVAAERERNVVAVEKIIDVVLAMQPDLGRAFVVSNFRDLLHTNEVAGEKFVKKLLYTERNRMIELCGPLIEKVFFTAKASSESGDQARKHEFIRLLYVELQSDKLQQISAALPAT